MASIPRKCKRCGHDIHHIFQLCKYEVQNTRNTCTCSLECGNPNHHCGRPCNYVSNIQIHRREEEGKTVIITKTIQCSCRSCRCYRATPHLQCECNLCNCSPCDNLRALGMIFYYFNAGCAILFAICFCIMFFILGFLYFTLPVWAVFVGFGTSALCVIIFTILTKKSGKNMFRRERPLHHTTHLTEIKRQPLPK